jgi:thioredoxin reductase
MQNTPSEWDVIIVGAGPAGLSAALILGRCRREVLLCDRGTPRSWASHAMHAYLSRDGIDPGRFRETAHEELLQYPNVHFRADEAIGATRTPKGLFAVTFERGEEARCRKLLLATGVEDELPAIEGIEQYFGTSVFPCPYCDGWELRDAPIAVYGRRSRAFEMARAMTAWTDDILVCTDGPAGLSASQREQLSRNRIEVVTERIAQLRGEGGQLEAIRFASGREIARRAMFFDTPSHSQSALAKTVGCEFNASGGVRSGQYEASSVPGVFVAGNILKDVQLSIVAAAEGARAAFGINRALTREDFSARAGRPIGVDHPGPRPAAE